MRSAAEATAFPAPPVVAKEEEEEKESQGPTTTTITTTTVAAPGKPVKMSNEPRNRLAG